jgi:hypothetical protein
MGCQRRDPANCPRVIFPLCLLAACASPTHFRLVEPCPRRSNNGAAEVGLSLCERPGCCVTPPAVTRMPNSWASRPAWSHDESTPFRNARGDARALRGTRKRRPWITRASIRAARVNFAGALDRWSVTAAAFHGSPQTERLLATSEIRGQRLKKGNIEAGEIKVIGETTAPTQAPGAKRYHSLPDSQTWPRPTRRRNRPKKNQEPPRLTRWGERELIPKRSTPPGLPISAADAATD